MIQNLNLQRGRGYEKEIKVILLSSIFPLSFQSFLCKIILLHSWYKTGILSFKGVYKLLHQNQSTNETKNIQIEHVITVATV